MQRKGEKKGNMEATARYKKQLKESIWQSTVTGSM